MEIRSQLEVRGLFLKFLSQISARNKFALIKFLENIVNEHRNSKTKQNSENNSGNNETNNKNQNESYQTRYLRHSFETYFRQLESREYNKLISVIEFEIMKPSNLYGYLKEVTPELESNEYSSDSDIQIIEVIPPSPPKLAQQQHTKFSLSKCSSTTNTSNLSVNSTKSPINESNTSNSVNGNGVSSKTIKQEVVKQSNGVATKPSKKPLSNRILLLEQIAAKQTKASKLKLSKGLFKQIQYKDYVDYATNKLINTKLKAFDCKGSTITLFASVVGMQKNDLTGQECYLVEWKPENYAPKEWVPKEDFKQEKEIEINTLRASHELAYLDGLYKPIRYRSNKRK